MQRRLEQAYLRPADRPVRSARWRRCCSANRPRRSRHGWPTAAPARADRRDEVWNGTYVVAPAPHQRQGRIAARLIARLVPAAEVVGLVVADLANVGSPDDYRIPDVVIYRWEAGDRPEPYLATVELIVEVCSPGEEPEAKLPFYLDHQTREAVLIDPAAGRVRWLQAKPAGWVEVHRSNVLETQVGPLVHGLLDQ